MKREFTKTSQAISEFLNKKEMWLWKAGEVEAELQNLSAEERVELCAALNEDILDEKALFVKPVGQDLYNLPQNKEVLVFRIHSGDTTRTKFALLVFGVLNKLDTEWMSFPGGNQAGDGTSVYTVDENFVCIVKGILQDKALGHQYTNKVRDRNPIGLNIYFEP